MAKEKSSVEVEHLGLITAVLVPCIVAIRILAICKWDLQTAYVFIQEQGTTAALIGTLLSVMPMGILYFLYVVFYFGLPDQRENRATFAVLLTLVALAVVLSIVSQPLVGLILELLLVVAIIKVRRRLAREIQQMGDRLNPITPVEELAAELEAINRDALEQSQAAEFDAQKVELLVERSVEIGKTLEQNEAVLVDNKAELDAQRAELRKKQDTNRRTENAFLIAFGVVLATVLGAPPWLPMEQVGGDRPTVGWVLSQSEHQLVVLKSDSRRAIQLPPNTPHKYCAERLGHSRLNRAADIFGKPAFIPRLIAGAERPPWCRPVNKAPPPPKPASTPKTPRA